jgi:hypothetical protein
MEWIVNRIEEDFKYILFEFGEYNDDQPRRWEISVDIDIDNTQIGKLVDNRLNELIRDLGEFGNLDNSDLFVDYTTKKDNN